MWLNGPMGSSMGSPLAEKSYTSTRYEDLPEVSPRVITGPSYKAHKDLAVVLLLVT